MNDINIVVVRREILTKNFESKSEANRWIERQREKDEERRENKADIEYEIWHSPHPASE